MLQTIVALISTLAGLLGTCTLLVFMAAGSANLSPAEAAGVRRWMIGAGVLGVASVLGAAASWYAGRPVLAACLGGLPVVVVICAGVWTMFKS